jgi:hypothetical protein
VIERKSSCKVPEALFWIRLLIIALNPPLPGRELLSGSGETALIADEDPTGSCDSATSRNTTVSPTKTLVPNLGRRSDLPSGFVRVITRRAGSWVSSNTQIFGFAQRVGDFQVNFRRSPEQKCSSFSFRNGPILLCLFLADGYPLTQVAPIRWGLVFALSRVG